MRAIDAPLTGYVTMDEWKEYRCRVGSGVQVYVGDDCVEYTGSVISRYHKHSFYTGFYMYSIKVCDSKGRWYHGRTFGHNMSVTLYPYKGYRKEGMRAILSHKYNRYTHKPREQRETI